MALIVQKFGGTSVGSIERIRNVARRVAKWKAAGHDLVVVPSAMAGETNRLIALAEAVQPHPDPRELDVVASTGEQVTIGLLSMALIGLGVKARSYTGWQVKVLTDSAFTKTRIISIDQDRIRKDLKAGCVVVVAGFQGVDGEGNITTLGRGGSDTSAVALAAALSLGQVAGAQRRNERLLLTSFTNPQQFAPWLDALEESDARLAGVYSVPLLAPALAARLAPRAQRVLVVTVNRAGLRQCFIEDGKLRFARLERTADMPPQGLATFARSETLRLAQYLATLRALPRDGPPLQAFVVAPPGERAAFDRALASDARVAFHTIDSAQALGAVRLRRIPEATGAEALYLHLAASKPPREQFASRQERRRYDLWRLQRAFIAAGALGFAARCNL